MVIILGTENDMEKSERDINQVLSRRIPGVTEKTTKYFSQNSGRCVRNIDSIIQNRGHLRFKTLLVAYIIEFPENRSYGSYHAIIC
jgi:hypothetical protein